MNRTLKFVLLAVGTCAVAIGGWLYQRGAPDTGEQTSAIERSATEWGAARAIHFADGIGMSGDEIHRESNNVLVAVGNVDVSLLVGNRSSRRISGSPGTITADRATIDGDAGIIQAEGDVRFRVSNRGSVVVEAPEMTIRYREAEETLAFSP